jgi:competence protein ComEC
MNRKTKQFISRVGIIILLALLSLFIKFQSDPKEETATKLTNQTDNLEVHFIDVGQGDSIFIEIKDSCMLIDAGENNKGTTVLNYLEDQNVDKLDYVIATHPHSDHIGGLDTVLRSISADKVIMPDVTHTTATFEDVLDVLEEKGMKITKAKVGDKYRLGPASFEIISPNSDSYEDLNNYSVGIKLTYGNNSFLLAGDAEKLSEEEMLKNGIDLSSDVLKLGHHGSAYSSCSDFLDAVNPEYAVISVGADNEYGHPHAATMQAMKDRNIKIYRTDKQGTVVFTSDGNTISVNTDAYEITEDDLTDR